MARVGCWNHNVHYQPVILGAVPAICGAALDVGSIGDYLAGAPGVPVNLLYRAVYRQDGPGAPVKAADMTWAEVRATARRLLPGARYRRHLLWRYSLVWRKPG